MKRLVTLLLLFCSQAYGSTHDDFVHLTAHVGASYTLQTIFYGIGSRGLGMTTLGAESFALASTMAIGFAYKLTENAPASDVARAMAQNLAGSLLAIGTHITFHF